MKGEIDKLIHFTRKFIKLDPKNQIRIRRFEKHHEVT